MVGGGSDLESSRSTSILSVMDGSKSMERALNLLSAPTPKCQHLKDSSGSDGENSQSTCDSSEEFSTFTNLVQDANMLSKVSEDFVHPVEVTKVSQMSFNFRLKD